MKKTLLFFLMLLPCLGFSQTASELLVRWEGTRIDWSGPSNQPMYYYNAASGTTSAPTAFSAANISGSSTINYNYEPYSGFGGQNWPTGDMDYGKYFQVAITPGATKKIEAKNFKFTYAGRCSAYKIMYRIVPSSQGSPSDSSFNSATTLGSLTNIAWESEAAAVFAFNSGVFVMPGQTMYIRIYPSLADPNTNRTFLRHSPIENNIGATSSNGPAFYGNVLSATGVTAVADTDTTYESLAVTKDVTANDQATGTTISSVSIVSQPATGIATVNGNNITYTPTSSAGDKVITYKITGADGSTSTSTYTVTVNAYPNPTANNDAATTGQLIPVSVPVLANDDAGTASTFGSNSITIVTSPGALTGVTTIVGNNIVFAPGALFTGTATITYKVTNSHSKVSNVATVTINVVSIIAIIAQNDAITTTKNTAAIVPVLANDILGNSAVSTVQIVSNAAHGNALVNAANNTITYTPANNYTGADSFTYKVTDLYNTTSTATVNMSVIHPTVSGALCGTYVISSAQQAVYPQFTSITAAVNHLNTYGVSCPVTFLLLDNNYNEGTGESFPIVFNQFPGTSATNTVTFKPGYLKNVTVKANDITVNSSAYQATTVFQFNGADNIIFDGSYTTGGTTRNLTIFNNNSINYVNRACVWVAANGSNGATNITIKHTNLRQGYRNQDGLYTIGIFAGNNYVENSSTPNSRSIKVSDLAGADNSNLYVWNNDFMNVKQGVYVNGGSTVTTNVTILQNDLGAENNTESVILPVTLNNVQTFTVSENLIYNLYRITTDGDLIAGGINIKGNTKNGSIIKNNMRDLQRLTADANTFAGIVLASESTSCNILVANNFILDPYAKGNSGGYSNGYGIIVDNGGGYRILHNTVVLTKNQPIGGYSAALYVNSNASNLDVRNNIFVNNQTNTATRRSAIMVNNDVDNLNAIFTKLDYNNYYSADRIGYIANQQSLAITWPDNPDFVQTLSGWQGALGSTNNSANANNRDVHSISVNPVFASATDLHLGTSNGAMDNKGTAITEIPKDIDGQLRNTTTPDMGADEFGDVEMPAEGSNAGIYCSSSTTWNGISWSNGYPSADKDVIFRANKTFITENLYACSIFVQNGANVSFTTFSNAIVTHNVNVQNGSSLTFESSSNLIQIENAQNSGNVTVKRTSSRLKRLDYTMWSSPVSGSQTLLQFSPQTMTNRFYTYNTLTNLYFAQPDPSAVTFGKAKGYLIRVPNNHPNIPTSWTGSFYGTPNNGNVTFPLVYQSNTIGYNAVGNPYPSPISVAAFIDANIDNIEGTLWIWRKTNDWTQTSYSTVTKAGYTANAAPGGGSTDNDLVADPFQVLPDVGALNTGQGFIVKAKTSQNLVFRNNMRVANNFAYFFRDNIANEAPAQPTWSRIWLNIKNPNSTQDFTQTLIGYSSQTTLGYDNGFDGGAIDFNEVSGNIYLTSVISENSEPMYLAIQARPAFTTADVVTLAFKAAVAGTFEFSIDHMDGLFESTTQEIYIVDNLTGTTHNLRDGAYSFSTEAGTFNSRFRVVYVTAEELGNTTPVVEPQNVVVYRDQNRISINAPQVMKSVAVYDMLGRVLYQNNNVSASELTTAEITTAQQVVIVKITLENQQVVSKKIMMN